MKYIVLTLIISSCLSLDEGDIPFYEPKIFTTKPKVLFHEDPFIPGDVMRVFVLSLDSLQEEEAIKYLSEKEGMFSWDKYDTFKVKDQELIFKNDIKYNYLVDSFYKCEEKEWEVVTNEIILDTVQNLMYYNFRVHYGNPISSIPSPI